MVNHKQCETSIMEAIFLENVQDISLIKKILKKHIALHIIDKKDA